MMLSAFKYRIYPTKEQRVFLEKHFGACRYVYNYFLDLRAREYKENKRSISGLECKRMLIPLKKTNKWLKEINSQSLQEAVLNLEKAYQRFFKGLGKYPVFKRKRNHQSFTVPQHFFVEGNLFYIPKLKQGIRIKLHRPIDGVPSSLTISRAPSGKYYASFSCETLMPEVRNKPAGIIGIDLGITSFIATSNKQKVDHPACLRKSERKLARYQRLLSKKKNGSNNKSKQRLKVALLHEKISNQRHDFLHKLSRKIVDENQAVYLESLNVKGMMQNRHLSKSIADSGWSEFARQLKYKGEWYGTKVVQIGRFVPSTKTCSACDAVNHDLSLKDRVWTCPSCKTIHDRDINAATVIKKVGQDMPDIKPVEKRASVLSFKRKGKPASMKQEAHVKMHEVLTP